MKELNVPEELGTTIALELQKANPEIYHTPGVGFVLMVVSHGQAPQTISNLEESSMGQCGLLLSRMTNQTTNTDFHSVVKPTPEESAGRKPN